MFMLLTTGYLNQELKLLDSWPFFKTAPPGKKLKGRHKCL